MNSAMTRANFKIKAPTWHAAFLVMLPRIRQHAQITFRKVRPELRDDLVQEVIVNAYVAYARLVELNKEDQAFPSDLAQLPQRLT